MILQLSRFGSQRPMTLTPSVIAIQKKMSPYQSYSPSKGKQFSTFFSGSNTMKALVIEKFGGIDEFKLVDMPKPKLKKGHVVIEVKASSVNPLDYKIRNGINHLMAPEFPAVLHGDVAGIIMECEEDSPFKIGDEVYGCAGGTKGHSGALAEYMLADARLVAHKPKSLSMIEAAALPLVGITAWEALMDKAKIHKGQQILIHGATGGVGHIAIQLAVSQGADVYATASTTEKLETARRLGATPINYKETSVTEYVSQYTQGKGFDVILDTVGGDNLQKSFEAAAVNGIVTAIATRATYDLTPLHMKGLSLHVIFMLTPLMRNIGREHHGEILKNLATLVDTSSIKPLIDSVYDFTDVGDAHAHLSSGKAIGKVGLVQNLHDPMALHVSKPF